MPTELTGRAAPAPRRPPAAAGPRRPQRRRWRALQLLGVLAGGLTVWGLIAANPSFPAAPELRGVRLDAPAARATSAPLLRLLRDRTLYGSPAEPLVAAREALGGGRWPARPLALSAELERLDPPLAEFRAALLAPGCLPATDLAASGSVSHIGLYQGVRLLAVAAASAAQRGDAGRAADELLPVLARLGELERCPPSLLGVMVLAAAIGVAHDAVGFLLADPQLDDERVGALLARSAALARRPSAMAAAMRAEAAFRRAAIASLRGDTTARAAGRGGGPTPRAWPWYDEGHTLSMSDQLGRRHVWLAERDPASADWTRPAPEEAYFAGVREQPAALALLRFNAVGIQTLALLAPLHRPQIARWYQQRCAIAAQRARWLADLRRRGRRLAGVAGVAARDPFTRRTFEPQTMRSFCSAPTSHGASAPDAGELISPLPPPPAVEAPR